LTKPDGSRLRAVRHRAGLHARCVRSEPWRCLALGTPLGSPQSGGDFAVANCIVGPPRLSPR
jgi:hypothetical protein